MDKLKVIDLFCGGGGLSQGLMDAGMEISAAFDNWEAAITFYKKNIHGHPVEKLDLLDSDSASERIKQFDFDIIVGGPPCQDFSSAGKRDEAGGRANLTISFADIIQKVRPKYFIMENVERAQKTKTFAGALTIFKNAGYGLTVAVLDASLCGAPQKRKRVLVIGILNSADNVLISEIRQRQDSKPMTIREFFGEKFGLQYYYRHPRSYARRAVFSIDEPSPTIRGVNRPVPKGYPGHSGDPVPISSEIRPLTTKERSLIQTFPEKWDVSGSKAEIEQIIGNAVPVKMAEFIGKCFLQVISTKPVPADYQTDRDGHWVLFEQKSKYTTNPSAGEIHPKCKIG